MGTYTNFNGATIEVWERINTFISIFSHFTGHVITYPWWDWSNPKLVQGAPCYQEPWRWSWRVNGQSSSMTRAFTACAISLPRNGRWGKYIFMFSKDKRNESNGPVLSSCPETVVHYDDVIMTTLASQITSITVVYLIVYSGVDERRYQSSASLAFVRGIHRDRWIPRTKGQ